MEFRENWGICLRILGNFANFNYFLKEFREFLAL